MAINPGVVDLDASYCYAVDQINPGRKRKWTASPAEERRSAMATSCIAELAYDAIFEASVVRAAQVQQDRHDALQYLAWDKQCARLSSTWPATPLFPTTTTRAASLGWHDSTISPENDMFTDAMPGESQATSVDFDHELEFELNTAMGRTWTASHRTLPSTSEDLPSATPKHQFVGPGVTSQAPSSPPWTALPMPPPFGPPCHVHPASHSPKGGSSVHKTPMHIQPV